MSADLLVELFAEELPPMALRSLGKAFGESIASTLMQLNLKQADSPEIRTFASPRRIAVLIPAVRETSSERAELRKLMPSKVAFDAAGQPSAALLKRLAKEGGNAEHIERRTEGTTEYVFLNQVIPGLALETGLQGALQEAIAKLPIPKVMSYQLADGTTTVRFVRPAHGLVALHGENVLAVTALGLTAGRVTHGHRFQGAKDIVLKRANEYETRLEDEGRVIADFETRKSEIGRQLADKARTLQCSLGADIDYGPLLDEVTALVELPTVYVGEFEPDFLAVPQECLVLTMRRNQKYFPLFDASGKLTNRFLIVSNMRLADPKNIVEGNQRVVRPRFADARFFFDTDRKTRLADRVAGLAAVVYHNKLGSQLARLTRVENLAAEFPRMLGVDEENTNIAAHLIKADLLTSMVGEFPELQGVMGKYYAQADGFPSEVCQAIEEHYQPRFAGDALPSTMAGAFVALADKLETLVGLFGVGQQPTGEKDPFALRRHALGVIRILIEKNLSLNLDVILKHAVDTFHGVTGFADPADELMEFILDRLRGYLRDQGFASHEIEAVMSAQPARISEVLTRLNAVRAFSALPEAQSLAAANKRIGNIIRKSDTVCGVADPKHMSHDAELDLYKAIEDVRQVVEKHYAARQYTEALLALAGLRPVVDRFFDQVLVNAEDPGVRVNRLRLLTELNQLMNKVADISKLAA